MLAALLAQPAGGQVPQGCGTAGPAASAAFSPHAEPLAAIAPRFGPAAAAGSGPASPVLAYDQTGLLDDSLVVRPAPAWPRPLRLAVLEPVASLQSAEAGPPAARASALPKPDFGEAKSAYDGDFLIVGVGVAYLPDYEGSSQKSALLAGAFAGKLGGIGISPRAAGFALDLVPERGDARIGLSFGPVFRLRMNRAGAIKDPVVASLGRLRTIIEGGVNLGLSAKRVFNRHDQLSIGTDLRWDISGKGGGGVISPAISYLTPVSRGQVVGLLASAEFANRRFASYNYDITPAGSAASGLPAFTARR